MENHGTMIYLFIVSFIWAFSFGLIKGNLTGLDSGFVAFSRMLIAFALFAPFMRLKSLDPITLLKLFCIGAIQFGVMYVTYIYSYQFLQAHQVALYTIFTPLYVTLINDMLDRTLRARFLLTSALAILGAYIIVKTDLLRFEVRAGFLLLQVSNICFALGQVLYKKELARNAKLRDRHVFGILYLGALVITACFSAATTNFSELRLTTTQTATLAYLGLLASGLGFFLWNVGARKTRTSTLAIFNNLKVPLAVACSIFVFHEQGDVKKLLIGGGCMVAALFLNDYLCRDQGKN
ncbi:MAG: EamA family transporter [Planctomycetota bacterium]